MIHGDMNSSTVSPCVALRAVAGADLAGHGATPVALTSVALVVASFR